ncbi:MAG: mechanosensitive ion channel domain-containing protein [Candidatus Bathyarchaeia archaeon]
MSSIQKGLREKMAGTEFLWIVNVAVAIVGFWLFGEFLIRVITSAAKRAGLLTGQIRLIKEWIWLLIALLAVGVVVHIIGLASQFTILTISGIIALAFSLALQTTLSNVISGILLLLDNTLRVNDLVEFSAFKGQVVKIGLRSTWIKTGEGNIVITSNNSIVNGPLTNITAAARLQKEL